MAHFEKLSLVAEVTFKKGAQTVKNAELLGYGAKSLNVQGFDAQAKISVFSQLALLSNNIKLMSY